MHADDIVLLAPSGKGMQTIDATYAYGSAYDIIFNTSWLPGFARASPSLLLPPHSLLLSTLPSLPRITRLCPEYLQCNNRTG